MTSRIRHGRPANRSSAAQRAVQLLAAIVVAVPATLVGKFAAHCAAFTLVTCPPGTANAACPIPSLSTPPLTSPHSGSWLLSHLAGSWPAVLLIGFVALSEVARAPLARRAALQKPESWRWLIRARFRPLARVNRALLGTVAALLLLSALACIVVWTRSTSETVVAHTPYQQHGSFSYSAPASGTIYDGDAARSGQPIFLALSHEVDLTFAYSLSTEPQSQLSGTYWLSALVGDSSGWRKTIDLVPQNGFSGSTFSASATLDLQQVRQLVDDYERQTGLHRDQYLVAIVAQIGVRGTIAGRYFDDTFAPELDFTFDHSSLRLADHPASVDPLSPTADGAVDSASAKPATIGVGGVETRVSVLRWIVAAELLFALAAAVGLLWRARHAAPIDEQERFRHRYGQRLVAIRHGQLADAHALDVRDIDDLGRLAEQLRLPILVDDGTPRYYYVRHGGQLYRCRHLVEPAGPLPAVEELFR